MAGSVTYWRDPDGWCFAVESQETNEWSIVIGPDTDSCVEITEEDYQAFIDAMERQANDMLVEFEEARKVALEEAKLQAYRDERDRQTVISALEKLGLEEAALQILRGKSL